MDSPADDPEKYWDFSWHEFAYDVIASAKAMTENAAGNYSKGWYFGFSQGTTQALVGLTRFESEMEKYLERVILLAPCFGYASIGDFDNQTPVDDIGRAGYIKD